MILVVNLNLAVDKTVNLHSFEKGGIHRFTSALTLPGGKGVNVARALKSLGFGSEIWGFVSGHNGRWIRENLSKEGFKTRLINHEEGESRICYSMVENGGISTDFNEDGPPVPLEAQKKFLSLFKKEAGFYSALSVSGRSSPGLVSGFYRFLVKQALSKGLLICADAASGALKECVQAGAGVVKINNYEFEDFHGKSFSSASLKSFYRKNRSFGLKTAIVTNRNKPFYCCHLGKMFRIIPPVIKNLQSPVGAGDSFLAGLISCFLKKEKIEKALVKACAAACADCVTLGAGLIKKEDLRKFAAGVKLEELA